MIIPICIALAGFTFFVVCCLLDILFPAARAHVHHAAHTAVRAIAGQTAIEPAHSALSSKR